MTVTVLVADDQSLIRTAVGALISHEPGLELSGAAVDGADAVAQARHLHPDVVLMDIRMPVMDGIAATAQICSDPDLSDTRVLVLTTFEEDEYVLKALRAGASGFIGKGTEAPELMAAIRVVHDGEALLSPRATRALIDRYTRHPEPAQLPVPAELRALTEREREVLLRVGQGQSNIHIAHDLFISVQTAKTHVNRIMSKLAVHDRAQLVIITYEAGLLRPGPK